MTFSIKLLSQILKILKISITVQNNEQKYYFQKMVKFSEFSKKRNMCERTMPGVYDYKIAGRYLEKMTEF